MAFWGRFSVTATFKSTTGHFLQFSLLIYSAENPASRKHHTRTGQLGTGWGDWTHRIKGNWKSCRPTARGREAEISAEFPITRKRCLPLAVVIWAVFMLYFAMRNRLQLASIFLFAAWTFVGSWKQCAGAKQELRHRMEFLKMTRCKKRGQTVR